MKILERFWRLVDVSGDCWMWTGARGARGHGKFSVPRQGQVGRKRWVLVYAHRAALMISGVNVPDDKLVCHRCNNPSCVRPDHLYVGTAMDNTNDRVLFGRNLVGELNHKAKLSAADVVEIRRKYTGKYGELARIGREYGVCGQRVGLIVRGLTWKHIPMDDGGGRG